MFKLFNRILRILIVLTLGAFSLFFILVAWFVMGFHSESRTLEPRLAFWMEHAWSQGTQKDFALLAEQIKSLPITDLYFHVGPINADGSLAQDLDIFGPGLDTLNTVNYAWMGQVRSEINLDDSAIRQKIISSAEWALGQGFKGIHLDIEPIRPNDEGFFTLLSELRTALPEAKLSVAMDEWQPHGLSQLLASIANVDIQSYWTSKQVKEVAEFVDQIVVMTYDTQFKDPSLYEWWVEQQTVWLSNLLPENTELFVGIPSYENGVSISPNAENLKTGLAGFSRGVQNLRTKLSRLAGIAVYSYWEMDDSEWKTLSVLANAL